MAKIKCYLVMTSYAFDGNYEAEFLFSDKTKALEYSAYAKKFRYCDSFVNQIEMTVNTDIALDFEVELNGFSQSL